VDVSRAPGARTRFTQVKQLRTLDAFRAHLDRLNVTIPTTETDPAAVLATPVEIRDAARTLRVPNRCAVLPMEGWDGSRDGHPTELVRRRWQRFGASGCGLVWGEATAVRADGRANPNQLVITDETVADLAGLREVLAPGQVAGLQLTHSGRWSRPDGTPAPRTAYAHPILDTRADASAASVLGDDDLDELVAAFVDAAARARDAGFDFVDIKHCHGYLLHELLTAYDRPGRYGGDLTGRTAFLRAVVTGIRARVPDLAIAVRLSTFDLVPYTAGANGTGEPEVPGDYAYAFGGDGTGAGIDLTETHAFLDILATLGVGLLGTTAGSPYYNPHVQRPAYFPPSDGYQPPEDPLAGVARQIEATAALAVAHPRLTIVGAGYSYLQEWLPNVAAAVVAGGGAAMVGIGRMALSYPEIATDVFAGRPLDARRLCRTFSDCTTAPRNGLVSGCYPLDPFYKSSPQRVELTRVKKATKAGR
jgi:2,4-dienoyl-CoA reductase-like NADH-dependent reductase (Old Yellow Enzyme family)